MNLMRVIEPHQLRALPKRKPRRRYPFVFAGLVLASVGVYIGLSYFLELRESQQSNRNSDHAVVEIKPIVRQFVTPKTFSGSEFKDLYLSVLLTYPNTEPFQDPPAITGNITADKRIQSIAEARGFRLTKIPVSALVKTDEPKLKGQTDDLLQPLAFEGWQGLKAAAALDGIPLELYSAYRSPDWQRGLFLERMKARGITVDQIVNGYADGALKDVLSVTGIPGYSRHHSGYAVDFWCEDGSGLFANSSCAAWLERDNYLQAKKFGWIPSYPDGAGIQGPEPEPWEYVWVGKSLLFKD